MDKLPPSSQPTGVNKDHEPLVGQESSISNESGKPRHVASDRKPESSLSAAKHPFRYIGLAISHLFSRVIDSAYCDIGKFTRKTERMLENPFISHEEKQSTLDQLIKTLSNNAAASPREYEEIEDLVPDLIKKIANKEDANRLQEAGDHFLQSSRWARL